MDGQSYDVEYVGSIVSVLKRVVLPSTFETGALDPIMPAPPRGNYTVGKFKNDTLPMRNSDGSYQFYWRGWEDGST
jgi:hypothetical protein